MYMLLALAEIGARGRTARPALPFHSSLWDTGKSTTISLNCWYGAKMILFKGSNLCVSSQMMNLASITFSKNAYLEKHI